VEFVWKSTELNLSNFSPGKGTMGNPEKFVSLQSETHLVFRNDVLGFGRFRPNGRFFSGRFLIGDRFFDGP
jgi:hypothetical protein